MDEAHLYANAADQSLKRHLGKVSRRQVFTNNDDGFPFTSPVGHFRPNAFGLHDMLGNVLEWCADRAHDSYVGAPTDGSAWLSIGTTLRRVLRGGAWDDHPGFIRSGVRFFLDDGHRRLSVGFRLARTFSAS